MSTLYSVQADGSHDQRVAKASTPKKSNPYGCQSTPKKSKSGSTPKKSRSPAKHKKSETGKSPHKYWTYTEEVSDQDDANEKEPALGKGQRIRKRKIRDGDWFYC